MKIYTDNDEDIEDIIMLASTNVSKLAHDVKSIGDTLIKTQEIMREQNSLSKEVYTKLMDKISKNEKEIADLKEYINRKGPAERFFNKIKETFIKL